MAFETRRRDKNGEISRKHGNTYLRTLRKTYGLIRDPEAGYLEQICS